MKIGIIGSRGIPNSYGGFEQFAEVFSVEMHKRGHDVTVYCTKSHPFKALSFKGVKRILKGTFEKRFVSLGQIIYDLKCILDSRKHRFDFILVLGYATSSPWFWLFRKKVIFLTNMDGLEAKRAKFNFIVKTYILFTERIAVQKCKHIICDSFEIKKYFDEKYKIKSRYLSYGAHIETEFDQKHLEQFNLKPNKYYLTISRFEPENNLETIIKGYVQSKSEHKLVIIGNTDSNYSRILQKKYANHTIVFIDKLFNRAVLAALRHFAILYFHGHSVGGTTPSLLEAMAAKTFICAQENVFNREILEENACYFKNVNDIQQILENKLGSDLKNTGINNNFNKINSSYNWNTILDNYESYFNEILNQR